MTPQFQQKMRNSNPVKVQFMAELLHWTALDCADVPNKMGSQCK